MAPVAAQTQPPLPARPALALFGALDLIFKQRPELVEKLYALALVDGCDVPDLIIDAVEGFLDDLAGEVA